MLSQRHRRCLNLVTTPGQSVRPAAILKCAIRNDVAGRSAGLEIWVGTRRFVFASSECMLT